MKNKNILLVIGHVWPESATTAAGRRMLQLLKQAKKHYTTIVFASSAHKSDFSDDLTQLVDKEEQIELNDSSFNDFLKDLQPNTVLFDRFLTEEQFGWRVKENCKNAVTVLDTEDLHCLRLSRELALKKNKNWSVEFLKKQEITFREIASIIRTDYSLLISRFEMQLLKENFSFINASKFIYLPFIEETELIEDTGDFESRAHFITIGNLHHNPNADSVLYIYNTIWKSIRKQLPEAKMLVYGAHAPQKIKELHKPEIGFYILNRANSVKEVFTKAKVCLAPLRFGAGIKGKFLEAMQFGLPSVTTTIGAESMIENPNNWNGFICNNPQEIIDKSVELYTNKQIWTEKRDLGFKNYKTEFFKPELVDYFFDKIKDKPKEISNFEEDIIAYHSNKNYKYLSKWIEEKNK